MSPFLNSALKALIAAMSFYIAFPSAATYVSCPHGVHNLFEIIDKSLPAALDADSLFVEFIKGLPDSEPSKEKAIKDLLDKASSIPDNFLLIYDLADRYLADPDSDLKDEGTYIFFLNDVLASPIPDEAEMERAAYRLKMAKKNRPGSKAADFKFLDCDGNASSLYDSRTSNNILLLFFDPDCDHCIATLNALKSMPLSDSISVMAIDISGDTDLWNITKPSLPGNWISGFATDPIEDNETYIFQTMPTLYLLDKNLNVILKDTSIEKALNHSTI